MRQAVGSLEKTHSQSVRGLLLDTDVWINSLPKEPSLTTIYMNASECTRALQMRSKSPQLDNWMPNFPISLETSHGSFGNKSLGRLTMVINLPKIIEIFGNTVQELMEAPVRISRIGLMRQAIAKRKAQAQNLNDAVAPGGVSLHKDEAESLKEQAGLVDFGDFKDCTKELEIIICASLGGGTGSIHCELAYALRNYLEKQGIVAHFKAVLPISVEIPESQAVAANVYAGLLELNHWMDASTNHAFAVDFAENRLWMAADEEEHKEESSTADILAHLDIFLANNVVNVNPGLGHKSDKTKEEEQKPKELYGDNVNLEDSREAPYERVLFTTVENFDDQIEWRQASRLLFRICYWYYELPELYNKIMEPGSSADQEVVAGARQSLSEAVLPMATGTLSRGKTEPVVVGLVSSLEECEDSSSRNYFDFHAFRIASPSLHIMEIARDLASLAVVSQLRLLLFEKKEISEDRMRSTVMVKEFLEVHRLDSLQVHELYQKRCQEIRGGRYNVEAFLKAKLDYLHKKPKYGKALEDYCKEFDEQLKSLVAECEVQDDFYIELAEVTGEIIEECTNGLENIVRSVVNVEHNGLLLACLLEDLTRQISFGLSTMHERTNNAESEAVRLEEAKNRAIAKMADFNPPLLKRAFSKVDYSEINESFKVITDYYNNVFTSYLGREEIKAFFGILNACDDLKRKLDSLKILMEESSARLRAICLKFYDGVLEDSDEQLCSTDEAAKYIALHSSPQDLNSIILEIDKQVGYNFINIPKHKTVNEWLEILRDAVDKLYPMSMPHVVETLLKRYTDVYLTKRLQTIGKAVVSDFEFNSSVGGEGDRSTVEEKLYVAFDSGLRSWNFYHPGDRHVLYELVHRLRGEAASICSEGQVIIVDTGDGEAVDFIDVCGAFSLRDLQLEDYKKAYISALVHGARALHSRKDVSWCTLRHSTYKEHMRVSYLLAAAFKMGVLVEQEDNLQGDALRLSSSEWTDLAAVRTCLETFADPVDALLFESDFCRSLLDWHKKQIASKGVEAWLKMLEPGIYLGEKPYVNDPRSKFASLDLEKCINNLKEVMSRELGRNKH